MGQYWGGVVDVLLVGLVVADDALGGDCLAVAMALIYHNSSLAKCHKGADKCDLRVKKLKTLVKLAL